jgi:hypothetical protein
MTTVRTRTRARAALLGCALVGLLAAAGCGAGSSGSQPSWAGQLGSGVTVSGPAKVAPGNGSPAAAVSGLITAFTTKQYSAECAFLEPSNQANCATAVGQMNSSNAPYASNTGIGYVAVHGSQALVGTTGTFCSPGQTPECYTNSDPAAIFSSGKSFSDLWAEANQNSSQNAYTLAPCVEISGKWYIG